MMRFIWIIILFLFIAGCWQEQEEEKIVKTIRPVLVQKVSFGDHIAPTIYAGEINARYESDLAFRVPGKIIARYVDVGDQVKPGTLLAQLDPIDMKLNVQTAQAQVAAAESEHTLAEIELERHASLLKKKFITQAEYDARMMTYKATKAKLELAQAQLAVMNNQATYNALYADQNGIITTVLAEVGQVVNTGQVVIKLIRPEEKEVVINVPENRVEELKSTLAMKIVLWAQPEVNLSGQLRELAPSADPTTRTYTARIRLLHPDPAVQLGMTAHVILQAPNEKPTLLVPLAAVIDQGQGPMVWVVENNQAIPRHVKVKKYREDGVLLSQGLQPGEWVVVVGAHKLFPHQGVQALEQQTIKDKS